jgi:hypothetical protein
MDDDDMTMMIMTMMKKMTVPETMMTTTMTLGKGIRPAEETVGLAGGPWCNRELLKDTVRPAADIEKLPKFM